MDKHNQLKIVGNRLTLTMIGVFILLILVAVISSQISWLNGENGQLFTIIIVAVIMSCLGIYSWKQGKKIGSLITKKKK